MRDKTAKSNPKVECVHCNGKNVVKRGKQQTNSGLKQVYYCRNCRKRFVLSSLKGKSFDAKVILNAVSYYNLGNSLEQSSRLVNKKFKVKTSKSSVHNWLNEFKDICPYHRIRGKNLKQYGENIIASKLFRHRGLTYNYKYHKAKLDHSCVKYNGLSEYLKGFENNFPHRIFERDERCSQIKINIKVLKNEKDSYACKLAKLALSSASGSRERHALVEDFMLVNDTATVAVEVPVWFWERKIINSRTGGMGICGHIDLLQVRSGNVYVLDFKPNAAAENIDKVCSQLYLYALGLSFRSKVPLSKIRCAWFDANNYFEFEPVRAEVR